MKTWIGGALLLLLAGCVSAEKIDGTTFDLSVEAHGTAKRFVAVEARLATPGGPGRTIEIDDVTTIDDDAAARRKLRIEPSTTEPGQPRPGPGHVEFASVAVRPIDIVIVYRGHEDIYHLTFPRDGGVLVEPRSGEFTRISVVARAR